METFECEVCGKYVDVEKIHLLVDIPEHVEFNHCKECFEASLTETK